MEVDVNGDGTIDFDEFKDMMKKQGDDKDPAVELLEAFKLFDKDKDGFISMRELKKVATMMGNSLSKEEVEEFLQEAEGHDTVRNEDQEIIIRLALPLSPEFMDWHLQWGNGF